MTHYLTPEQVIQINIRNCSDSSGVLNRDGVEGAVARPRAGFAGYEEYPDVWSKAAVLLHGLSSTQYFSNGNKRTAWLSASAFLLANASPLRNTPMISREAFVLAVAAGLFTVPQTSEWLYENRLRSSDRLDFALLAGNANMQPDEPGVWRGEGLSLSGIATPVLPNSADIDFVFRIRWHPVDAGRSQTLTFSVHPLEGGTPVAIFSSGQAEKVWELERPVSTGHPNHKGGMMPYLGAMRLSLLFQAAGRVRIVMRLNGEMLASLPLDVNHDRRIDSVLEFQQELGKYL